MNDLIKNIFSFIPDHVDNNLRYLLIFLITVQFTSFLLFIFLSTRTYLKMRKQGNIGEINDNINNDNDKDNGNNDSNNDNLNKEKSD
jgi:hypothetical protein